MHPIEQEVVFLKAASDIIDSMVNHDMMTLHEHPSGSHILFRTSTHQRLFNIFLVEFLSRTDNRLPVERTSFLSALEAIVAAPHFDVSDSVATLRTSVKNCFAWLSESVSVPCWLPTIDTEAVLTLPRQQYLKMCGNIAKHDPLRLVSVADELKIALTASGVSADRDDALLALDDFYQRFHTDILNYQASTIAALLNEIRWGIHEYLLPEFHRSYSTQDCKPPMYKYTYPTAITGKVARQRYWDLMNAVRSQPWVPRFRVDAIFQMRY